MERYGDFGYHHHGPGVLGAIVVVLLVGLALAVLLWLVLRLTGRLPEQRVAVAGPRPDGALETVRLRYARGEIDRDEFARLSADLGAPPPPQ